MLIIVQTLSKFSIFFLFRSEQVQTMHFEFENNETTFILP